MMIFEKACENAQAIRSMGRDAIEASKRAGIPAYYTDPSMGEGMVREMPDGTRHLVRVEDGEDVVIEPFAARP